MLNVKYGGHPQQNFDVYPAPLGGGIRPVVVVVHGGGWIKGDNSSASSTAASEHLADNRYVVVNTDYRLATENQPGVSTQHKDLEAVVDWTLANIANYGGDPTQIHLMGGSAGAQLVALVGQLINQRRPGLIRSIVSFSGPMDFVELVAVAKPGEIRRGMPLYLGCGVEELEPGFCTVEQLRDPSPLHQLGPTTPPMLLVNSTDEMVPLWVAEQMADAMWAKGLTYRLLVVSGRVHGLQVYPKVQDDVLGFLNSMLPPVEPPPVEPPPVEPPPVEPPPVEPPPVEPPPVEPPPVEPPPDPSLIESFWEWLRRRLRGRT